MTKYSRRSVVLTAITAVTAQEIRFGADVEYLRIKNNGSSTVFVLDEAGGSVVDVIWPGDLEEFGVEVGNSMRVYSDAASTAAEIAAGSVLFLKYTLRKER